MSASGSRNPASKAMALALVLGAGAWGDYSPLLSGNHIWVYAGKGAIQPLFAASEEGRNGKVVDFNETLRLRTIGVASQGGKTTVRVEERDSLYARMLWNRISGTGEGSLPDTVIVRTLVYTYVRTFSLAKGDSLGFGHRDSMDLFFWSRQTVPFQDADLTGLTAPWKGVSSNIRAAATNEAWTQGSAWYLDGVGLYWAHLGTACGMCGCQGSRELMLQSFDGKPVDPGVDPAGTPLAKGNKIACGLAQPSRRGPAFVRPGAAAATNVLGRNLERTVTSQGKEPKRGR